MFQGCGLMGLTKARPRAFSAGVKNQFARVSGCPLRRNRGSRASARGLPRWPREKANYRRQSRAVAGAQRPRVAKPRPRGGRRPAPTDFRHRRGGNAPRTCATAARAESPRARREIRGRGTGNRGTFTFSRGRAGALLRFRGDAAGDARRVKDAAAVFGGKRFPRRRSLRCFFWG